MFDTNLIEWAPEMVWLERSSGVFQFAAVFWPLPSSRLDQNATYALFEKFMLYLKEPCSLYIITFTFIFILY